MFAAQIDNRYVGVFGDPCGSRVKYNAIPNMLVLFGLLVHGRRSVVLVDTASLANHDRGIIAKGALLAFVDPTDHVLS